MPLVSCLAAIMNVLVSYPFLRRILWFTFIQFNTLWLTMLRRMHNLDITVLHCHLRSFWFDPCQGSDIIGLYDPCVGLQSVEWDHNTRKEIKFFVLLLFYHYRTTATDCLHILITLKINKARQSTRLRVLPIYLC